MIFDVDIEYFMYLANCFLYVSMYNKPRVRELYIPTSNARLRPPNSHDQPCY